MENIINTIVTLLIVVMWLVGIVISKGFWSCLIAVLIPPYAWYLVIEYIMQVKGLI